MKNKLLYTFLFTLLVVAGLFAMHFLPSVSFRGEPLRRVDLLSDIRIKKEIAEPMDSDTLVLPPPVKPVLWIPARVEWSALKNMPILQGVEWSIFMKHWEKFLLWTARYVLPISEIHLLRPTS